MVDAPQADPNQLHPIGRVAALNIVKALGLDESAVPEIERAIKDEITAMTTHFTLAFADVQAHYQAELLKLDARERSDG